MFELRLSSLNFSSGQRLVLLLIFIFSFLVLYISPQHQVEDSNYSMMVAEAVAEHHTTSLNNYNIPRRSPNPAYGITNTGYPYQLINVRGKLHLYFPEGTSVLSAPIVAILKQFGLSAVNPDGTYNADGELKLERCIAAFLCAVLAVLFVELARLWVPDSLAVPLALLGVFGTSIYSTASRAMWSHTWLVLLLTSALLIIFKAVKNKSTPNQYILATIVSWMYFVRPTSSISIIYISILVLINFRKKIVPYVLTGVIWLFLFVVYSKMNYGSLLPPYYAVNRIEGHETLIEAVAGNLISPSRGFFVYSPFFAVVFYILFKNWGAVSDKRIVVICMLDFFSQLIVVSGFPHWWAGFSYGPRFMTDTIPWLFVLLIMIGSLMATPASAGYVRSYIHHFSISLTLKLIFLLTAAIGIFFNAVGAWSDYAIAWNIIPTNVDQSPGRLWNWKDPQFLAFRMKSVPQDGRRIILEKSMVDIRMTLDEIKFDRVIGKFIIDITLTNQGKTPIGSELNPPVNLGAHLIGKRDGMVTFDFLRAPISPLVRPGSKRRIVLEIPEVDLKDKRIDVLPVQEGVAWFSDWGVKPLRVGPIEACVGSLSGFCVEGKGIGTTR